MYQARGHRFVDRVPIGRSLLWLLIAFGACQAPAETRANTGGGGGGSPNGGGASGDPDAGDIDADEGPRDVAREAPAPKPDDPQNVRACAAFAVGMASPVMGVSPYRYDAPEIALDKVHSIKMPGREAAHVGFEITTVGEHVLYVSTSASVAVFEIDGLIVPVKALRSKIQECATMKGRHTFDFKQTRYILRVGPESTGTVDLLLGPRGPQPATSARRR